MFFAKRIFFLVEFLLAVFLFSACSDDISGYSDDYPEYGTFKPSQNLLLYGSYDSHFYVKGFRVVRLDSSFNPVDTLLTQHAFYPDTGFVTGRKKFPSPYVKIIQDVVGSVEKNKMEFEFFRDLSFHTARDTLNRIHLNNWEEALLSSRIEGYLKKGLQVEAAQEHAKQDFYNALGEQWDSSWTEVLCRFQKSDSAFYKNFKELNSRLKEGKVELSDVIVRAADALFENISDYLTRNYSYDDVLNHQLKNKDGLDFMSYAYGMVKCGDYTERDSMKVQEKSSKFYGEVLVCDLYSVGTSAYAHVWRPISELEKKLDKMCLYNFDWNAIDGDELYSCNPRTCRWEKEEDSVYARRYIYDARVSEMYERCGGRIGAGTLRYYHDSLFICRTHYSYVDRMKDYWDYDETLMDRLMAGESVYAGKYDYYIDSTALGDACMARDIASCDLTLKGMREKACNGYYECSVYSDGSGAQWKSVRPIDFYHESECVEDSLGKIITLTEDLSNSIWECRDTTEFQRTVYRWLPSKSGGEAIHD